VDEKGRQVFLRGYNLGGWLMMEHFMIGFPGVEQQFRGLTRLSAGEEKSAYFFESFLNAFIAESDIKYLSEAGCTCLRVPFNYRHFEDDLEPFVYMESGFRHLDRLTALCKKYGLYIILDMHAVPGYQNDQWHSDNYTGEKNFFTDANYQKRFVELWKYIAAHYRDEETVAGYDLMNEPWAIGEQQKKTLNAVYKAAVRGIREVDKKHIVFIKGNMWKYPFADFDEPFDDNAVYSPHFYTGAPGNARGYPGEIGLDIYDKNFLEGQMSVRDRYMAEHNVPCWIGEFGINSDESSPLHSDRLRYLSDLLDIFNERGHSWSIWSYKDMRDCGVVHLDPASSWAGFTGGLAKRKDKFNCDVNTSLGDGILLMKPFLAPELAQYHSRLRNAVYIAARHEISTILMEEFALGFKGLTYSQLDELTASFRFEACVLRKDLESIVNSHM
jgi:aryl-phospho-beta-D-glucosidase BglC (GH1 family)